MTFTLLGLYILKGYLDPKIVKWRNEMAIRYVSRILSMPLLLCPTGCQTFPSLPPPRDANRKERRDILDYDLKRVREQQQEAFLKASKERPAAPAAKPAPSSAAKTSSAPPSRPSTRQRHLPV